MVCPNCGFKAKNKGAQANHDKRCKGLEGSLRQNRVANHVCPYCENYFKYLGNHQPYCKSNPNRVPHRGMPKGPKKWTEEQRLKLSAKMIEVVKENPESYRGNSGRVKIHEVDGLKLHGTWEVKVYSTLKSLGLQVERPSTPIPYHWNGVTHNYFPDFYLPEEDLYIEVKGFQFQPDRDEAKWNQIENLLVIFDPEDFQGL